MFGNVSRRPRTSAGEPPDLSRFFTHKSSKPSDQICCFSFSPTTYEQVLHDHIFYLCLQKAEQPTMLLYHWCLWCFCSFFWRKNFYWIFIVFTCLSEDQHKSDVFIGQLTLTTALPFKFRPRELILFAFICGVRAWRHWLSCGVPPGYVWGPLCFLSAWLICLNYRASLLLKNCK